MVNQTFTDARLLSFPVKPNFIGMCKLLCVDRAHLLCIVYRSSTFLILLQKNPADGLDKNKKLR